MSKDTDDRIAARGTWGTVEYAVNANGRMLAKIDLDRLKKKDKRRHVWIELLFVQFAETGNLRESKFKHLKDEICEFKASQHRVACFFIGNRCLLTHIFRKTDSKRRVSEEIEKAIKIMNEHMSV